MDETLAKDNIIRRELEIFLEFVVKENIPIEKRDNEIIETQARSKVFEQINLLNGVVFKNRGSVMNELSCGINGVSAQA